MEGGVGRVKPGSLVEGRVGELKCQESMLRLEIEEKEILYFPERFRRADRGHQGVGAGEKDVLSHQGDNYSSHLLSMAYNRCAFLGRVP